MTIPIYLILPIVILFSIAEWAIHFKEEKELYNKKDTLHNLALGSLCFLSGLLSKMVFLGALNLVYSCKIGNLGFGVGIWVLAQLGSDISFYWFHRISHQTNWFWASHVVHHSSENYNFSTALRLPWTAMFSGQFIFWMWMPFFGFNPFMVIIASQLTQVYQFWIHTESIGKLPAWFEFIFNTPSHHRVHHSSNPAYLDKNHGGILIIWDRIFNTFAEETEKPVYGLHGKQTPTELGDILFHEWKNLWQTASRAPSVRQAVQYLFMAPGLHPDFVGKEQTAR